VELRHALHTFSFTPVESPVTLKMREAPWTAVAVQGAFGADIFQTVQLTEIHREAYSG
jgi:hypothetical protein